MKRTSAEIPNFEYMINQIKGIGIISSSKNVQNKLDEKEDKNIDNRLECLCGTELILTNVCSSYKEKYREGIICNLCTVRCIDDIYHCPKGDVKQHPGGFDLCLFCGLKCFENRKVDKVKKKEERKLIKSMNKKREELKLKNNKRHSIELKHDEHGQMVHGRNRRRPNAPRINYKSSSLSLMKLHHKRSQSALIGSKSNWDLSLSQKDGQYVDGFMYPTKLKQLISMGYDQKTAKKLIIKYKGNMSQVMADLV